jgi:hypothetical protein
MLTSLRRAVTFVACSGALAACSDAAPNPASPAASSRPSRDVQLYDSEIWSIADIEDEFGSNYSLDSTSSGRNAMPYLAPADDATAERTFCRDHFKPIDLFWDGGDGIMRFHLDPPLLFVGYSAGNYRTRRGIVLRRAVYETITESEAIDPAGSRWRFTGRFQALCRGGEYEIGPVVFGAQILVAQNPLTHPVLVFRGRDSDGSCGGDGSWTGGGPIYMFSYDPYAPDQERDVTGEACSGSGSSGGSDGGDGAGNCTWDYVTIQISRDGGVTWETYWSGWAKTCDYMT